MRKLPLALTFSAGIGMGMMAVVGGQSLILLGLREFAFTIFYFLILMAVFNDLTLGQFSTIRKIAEKIKAFLTEEEIYFGVKTGEFFKKIKSRIIEVFSKDTFSPDKEQVEKIKEPAFRCTPEKPHDLIEIPKEPIHGQNTVSDKDNHRTLSALYILLFIGIALWRISRIFSVVPLSFNEQYDYSIVHGLLLLFFYCITIIYLKMRSTVRRRGDTTSYGLLTLLACVTLVYAGFIGVNSVLNIDILVALPWVYYAASFYVIAALAFNIMLSVFKNDVCGDFNYIILPKTRKNNERHFLDSDEVTEHFSLKSLYTFKYTLKILPGLVLALGFLLFISTTVFIVQPHQQAAIYRFGRLDRSSILSEGLHFKLPWPIDKAHIYDVHRFNSLQVGYMAMYDTMNFLWDRSHFGSEYLLLLGNGNELVSVNMKMVYSISDLFSYITSSADPESILSAAALEVMMNRTAVTTLDTFLSVDRDIFSASIHEELSAFSRAENLGLSVSQIIIESIHPPVDVAYVYQGVVSASVDKQTFITHAHADAQGMLIDAQRQSRVATGNALAEQQTRVSAAQREMAVYHAAMEAYGVNPESFRLNQYLATFETVINGNRVFVFSPGTESSIPKLLIGRTDGAQLWDLQSRR